MRFWRPNLERPLALSIHPDRRDRETELTGTAIQAIENALHVWRPESLNQKQCSRRCMYGRELKWLKTKKGGASLVKPPK